MVKKLFVCGLVFLLVVPALAQDVTLEATEAANSEGTHEVNAMFDYDQSTPPEITEVSSEMRGDVTIRDIYYTSPVVPDKTITAYLVVPPGEGPFPAILYVHWYERGAPNSNRTQFIDEAVSMAEHYGVQSLLVETMWSDPDWYVSGRTLESDYDDAIRQVIELRRGMDVLLSQPYIDQDRVAYVGHDFGGMYGALFAGVDGRAKAYVFIAAASNFNQWMLFGVPEDRPGLTEYMAHMDTIAPTVFAAQIAPAEIMFQFGSADFYTPQEDYMAFYNAASSPKQLHVYESEHDMEHEEIRENRITFLVHSLGLSSE